MSKTIAKPPAAQVAFAKKAAARKAAAKTTEQNPKLAEANQDFQITAGLTATPPQQEHDREHAHASRPPPEVRLLDKTEVCRIANVTFPTVWQWMRDGKFPRSRVVGGKSMWLSSEVEDWLASLPLRPLKGDKTSVSEAAAPNAISAKAAAS